MVLFLVAIQPVSAQNKGAGGGAGGGASQPAGSTSGDQIREQDRDRVQDPTTHDGDEPDQDRTRLQDRDRIFIEADIVATSSASLQQMVREREREMEALASTSDQNIRNTVRNENRVRLAVQALVASEDLLGGIGQQVSVIARQIGSSQASTSEAEKNIKERGFLSRLFFGGDKDSATIINREVVRNEERIRELNTLLADRTDIPEQIRTILMEQIRLMEEEQERLRQLSEEQNTAWGIFSWRF